MKSLTRAPSIHNCQRTSTYLSNHDLLSINKGEVTEIIIYDQVKDLEYRINAKDAKDSLLEKIYYSSDGGWYRCFNWMPLIKNQKTPKFTHLTQTQVADMLGVEPNRICELHRFDFLQPISKIAKSLFYKKEDVLKAMNEPRVKFWMVSLGVNSESKSD